MAAMENKNSCSWRLQSGQYLGEISALCFLHLPCQLCSLPYLVAGSGSQILLYDLELGRMINSFQIFQGIRVHGICCGDTDCPSEAAAVPFNVGFEIAVFGERRVKMFRLEIEFGRQEQVSVSLKLLQLLPKFGSWVLDVCFMKKNRDGEGQCLAIGCTDNSVHLWDVSASCVVLHVQHPERTLLYSMRLWGDSVEALRIASGTIYNEIIVWKVVSQHDASSLTSQVAGHNHQSNSFLNGVQPHDCQYEAVHICKLAGHEGSIFRISWSSNGSKLVSVSDDRSARVWAVGAEKTHSEKPGESIGLFGHSARVWDCCIFGSLIVTAGEDCTCRVWGLDGKHLQMIKEHIGRGIWRCLYDPNSSLLITAGFDSAIKVHQLQIPLLGGLEGHAGKKESDGIITYKTRIPTLSEQIKPMDSKSEYVRCLRFTCEDILYVATNNGYVYHARLLDTGEVRWTKLVRVSEEVPIVCMDLLSESSKVGSDVQDWIAVGDGKGSMTIVGVIYDDCIPKVGYAFTWLAGIERQLLGTHWCQSLGSGYVFTADPRGTLKLWRLTDHSAMSCDVSLLAEFASSFGLRIMCVHASLEEEVLVCGDIRGNLVLFPLLKSILLGTLVASDAKISPSSHFKGAHGISSVSSVAIARLSSNQLELRSTGADGCICYLEYDRDRNNLEFIGMKQVKELSLIQSVTADNTSVNDLSSCHYAAGFASVDFIIWNLLTDTKVFQIPCGGWRRPHSYYLGDVPELKNCFAYVKDDIIYIHRHCVLDGERKVLSKNLHMQFHGREMHSICFISEELQPGVIGKDCLSYRCSWIATGCEDGTVRLTRYMPGVENWSASKLLGEHVGGSAVRSICSVSKIYMLPSDVTGIPNMINGTTENAETPTLLISVGAKRVLTSWLLRSRKVDKNEETLGSPQHNVIKNGNKVSSQESPSMSFQWLSTDMPAKYNSTHRFQEKLEKGAGLTGDVSHPKADAESISQFSENGNKELNSCIKDKYEDDWRYMAVTAFLVKCANSRITVCFIAVACSDATLALRALLLPYRLWFDVALLSPLSSPVLALQHIILPPCLASEDIQIGSLYILISGATDGSVAFWDLTKSVEAFMQLVSVLDVEKFIDCQKRPRTGRGSQGGRWWRSLGSSLSKNRPGAGSTTIKAGVETDQNLLNHSMDGTSSMLNDYESSRTASPQPTASLDTDSNAYDPSSDICDISPFFVFKTVHQSGVNSLHVSDVEGCRSPQVGFHYNLVSGGDDQALSCLAFELSVSTLNFEFDNMTLEIRNSVTELGRAKYLIHSSQDKKKNYWIRFLSHDKVLSAHSSAVKGAWTDGSWVFSTGLDQRVRCWRLQDEGKLIEHAYMVISVPEPEALDVKLCGRNNYQIAVAGRGMQMLEFSEFSGFI